MEQQIEKKLTLVGAGPGDIGLITVKGLQAIKKAKVILYDALVNTDLLQEARPETELIYVGKRRNAHALPQEKINKLIVEYALTTGNVVRLKGGDSFVFGRGYEEIAYAEAFGIETEVIPGISSSISVAALQKIPVTSRGYSESFWVITGCNGKGQLSRDLEVAANTHATVVVLMGVNQLKQIVEVYQHAQRGTTAVAIIQNGSLPTEKYAVATIDTIVSEAQQKNIGTPAIIVIGKVVELHRDFEPNRFVQHLLGADNEHGIAALAG